MTEPELAEKLPTNDQGEHCLLGSMMLDPRRVMPQIQSIVSDEDYLDRDLGWLFKSLWTLHDAGKPINDFAVIRPLLRELEKNSVSKDFKWDPYIVKLIDATPYAAHAVHYAENVRSASRLRKMQSLAEKLQKDVADPRAKPDDVQEWLEGEVARLEGTQSDTPQTLHEASQAVLADLVASLNAPRRPGAMTGVFDIDSIVGPVMPGEVCVLAARTGCGKTALATQMALHSAEKGRPSLVCSLEMRQKELATRILCQEASVNSLDIRTGRYDEGTIERMSEAAESQKGLPIRLWAPRSATLSEIRGQARYQKAVNGLELLVVDYVGLVKVTGDDRRQDRHLQVQAVSAGIKELAKELDIPILLLCQLNRQGAGDEPELTNLRESGAIEQDADIVLLLNHGKLDPKQKNRPHDADVIIGKHRHGAQGKITVTFIPRETRFVCKEQSAETPQPQPTAQRARTVQPTKHEAFLQYGGSDDSGF